MENVEAKICRLSSRTFEAGQWVTVDGRSAQILHRRMAYGTYGVGAGANTYALKLVDGSTGTVSSIQIDE